MTLQITEEQARWFRARRAHLVGPGARNPTAAVHAMLGAHAQYEGPALMSIALRTQGTPTSQQLKNTLYQTHELVRTWGQRDTLHIFDPQDWPLVARAQRAWPQSGRRDAMPQPSDIESARTVFEDAGRPLTRADLFDHLDPRFVAEVAEHPYLGKAPERHAAGRLIWQLALAGDVCVAQKQGREQAYAARTLWHPELPWPDVSPGDAASALVKRYLTTYAPATPADVAHFFGATTKAVREWLKPLSSITTPIGCGSRKGLIALEEDVESLRDTPIDLWPIVLLPGFDTALMTHKDKSWIAADEGNRVKIWRKAAQLSATVMRRGEIVGTWTHEIAKKEVKISVEMHGDAKATIDELEHAAERIAKHCGVASFDIRMTA